jgi:phosphatidate cytidylyltransferase
LKNFLERALSGILISVLTVLSIVWHELSFGFFYMLILVMCVIEYYQLSRKLHVRPVLAWQLVLSIFLFAGAWGLFAGIVPPNALSLIIPLFFIAFISELYRRKKRVVQNIAFTFLPVIHVALPLALFIGLGYINGPYDYRPVLAVVLFTWTNDTFAYIVGVLAGKNKIAPKISPKKTWEGFAGGLLATIGLGFVLFHFWPMFSLMIWLTVAVLVSLAATLGDLVESMFKRSAGVKDSGRVLPGHGGVLDRFDGFVFAIPFVFSYLYLIN